MQASVLRALEFDRIVSVVRSFALTPMGDEKLARLTPATEPGVVAQQLAATSETARYLSTNGLFPIRAHEDLPQVLAALAVEQRALEPLRLLNLAGFLESVGSTRADIKAKAGDFPLLDTASARIAAFQAEVAEVRAKIDASGEVVDSASPTLHAIRERLRKQRGRLRGTLESYLRGRDTAKYLQDQVITERNGRFVLVVRAEQRGGIPGIVHGSSGSGASLYLEPLSTVEINNDIVALQEQEAEEVHRILLSLSDRFRSRPLDIQRTVDAAADLDVLQARARFSNLVDGVQPAVSADGAFELLAARHPLLMPEVQARLDLEEADTTTRTKAARPVPVTIRLLPPSTVLLVTGPNTGGKTVALKTAGLLALMAQAGLRIPAADGSRLPVFRSVFADIGDAQSIEASLSTFSAHVQNIASMDKSLQAPALVLLDEVGSGTDPVEGGALGVAIVDRFRSRGAMVVATSHYDALKTYASTTPGVACAAFGFDAETFAPTYQLVYGTPGRSLAIEIASRLGLHASVIEMARQNVGAREAQLAEHLARIDRDVRTLEHEQRLVARERETLAASEARLRQREEGLKQREDASRKRLSEELDNEVRRARRDIETIITGLKARTDRLAAERSQPITTGETGVLRSDARAAVEAVAQRIAEPAAALESPPPTTRPLQTGDRVVIGGLGVEGVVLSMHDGSVDVDVRGKRMRVPARDLRLVGGASVAPPRVNVHVELQPRDVRAADLTVIGCTVDEALSRTERFLDETLLGDQRVVRVIHGYGTGQLRRALAGYLKEHPLVAKFHAAAPEHGGDGVTVVELKD